MDLSGNTDDLSNPLTPTTGPVPPAQVQSSIPNWFSPSAWAQAIGGIPGSVEAWYSQSTLNPSYDAGIVANSVASAGNAAVDGVQSAVSSVTTTINTTVTTVTNWLFYIAIAAVAVAAIYFLSTIKGVLPAK